MQQDDLDKKATGVFAGKVVRKDLLHQIKGGENVPSYVLEYLLGKYCASDNDEEIRIGVDAVKETLTSNYFRHDEANKAQSLVERKGKHRFIDRIEPAGRTNAEAAFQKSLQVRDSRGNKASVVYFLTDGFELGQTDTNSFSRRIEEILRRSAPATQVNTIAFWPRRADRAMLQTIAERSGGQCVVIEQSGN